MTIQKNRFTSIWAVANTLVSGLLFLSLSNCTTVGNQIDPQSQDFNLSNSYAVQMYEQKKQQSQGLDSKDPRAYFHFLISLDTEKKFIQEINSRTGKNLVKNIKFKI